METDPRLQQVGGSPLASTQNKNEHNGTRSRNSQPLYRSDRGIADRGWVGRHPRALRRGPVYGGPRCRVDYTGHYRSDAISPGGEFQIRDETYAPTAVHFTEKERKPLDCELLRAGSNTAQLGTPPITPSQKLWEPLATLKTPRPNGAKRYYQSRSVRGHKAEPKARGPHPQGRAPHP